MSRKNNRNKQPAHEGDKDPVIVDNSDGEKVGEETPPEETKEDHGGENTTDEKVNVEETPKEEKVVETIEKEPLEEPTPMETKAPMSVMGNLMGTYTSAVLSGAAGAVGANRQFGLIEGINANFGGRIQPMDLLSEFQKHA